jgi:hypothetical protein
MSGNAFAGVNDNKAVVLSPYWQSDSGSYTFIAVSHTSLSGMASQIGVVVKALASDINSNTVANNVEKFGNSVTFTVTSGTTKRVFIVRSAHPTINPTSIPDAEFITGTSNFTHGSVRFDKLEGSFPAIPTSATMACSYETTSTLALAIGRGEIAKCTGALTGVSTGGEGFTDHTMMSYWGSVVVEKNTTGFAMEFLGDMNDSQGGHANIGGPIAGPAAP